MSNRRLIAILVSGAHLAACQTFAPRTYGPGYTETGVASWYGPDFHHKQTANGERFDMNGLTAAHQTLPFDSYVRVTNVASGRSVVVRINDRGPFVGDRIIDLSVQAPTRDERKRRRARSDRSRESPRGKAESAAIADIRRHSR
jgi:rare lipoprotein A (peptidoglycan hydrolase)